MAAAWRESHALLAERVRALPALLRADRGLRGDLPRGARRFVTTGAGSSAAHARFLAQLVAEHAGVAARFEPLGRFASPPPADAPDTVLVVFSQGLSPNAWLALADPGAWRGVVLVTAAGAPPGERGEALASARAAGVSVWIMPAGADEFGTLMRVAGPMAGYVVALRLAEAVTAAAGRDPSALACDVALVADRIADAPARVGAFVARSLPDWRTAPPVFVTSGSYGALVHNLALKVLEGMLLPLPPVWDVLDMAHGPLQQAHGGRATVVALTRPDAAGEAELVARLAAALDPERHVLLRLPATLPSPLAVFEHEAMLNELVLRHVAAHEIDQARFPGRTRDAALYDVGTGRRRPAPLAELSWPALADALAAGATTLVVPLGATEQHGPHLPFATDTWIAAALGERLCARLPDAVLAPPLPLGCSREHLAFPGTLDLGAETLEAVLVDVGTSARRHGFRRLFVFSAHGGNAAVLAALAPRLALVCTPLEVVVYADLARVTAVLHETAAGLGIAPDAAGYHAGEVETSIMAALRPGLLDLGALAPGRTEVPGDPQALFYPSLRDHAPSGVVGDPSRPSAARGERYLEVWVDELVAAYRGEKKSR
jgi:creatinine amidohydrolase